MLFNISMQVGITPSFQRVSKSSSAFSATSSNLAWSSGHFRNAFCLEEESTDVQFSKPQNHCHFGMHLLVEKQHWIKTIFQILIRLAKMYQKL